MVLLEGILPRLTTFEIFPEKRLETEKINISQLNKHVKKLYGLIETTV